MDVVGQASGVVGLDMARIDIPRIGLRGPAAQPQPAAPALPASLAALLLAHRMELEIDVCELFDAQLRGEALPLVDARVLRAYRTAHIPEAIHLTPDAVTRSAVLALPPGPFITVYGSDALRMDAVRTAHAIADMGFSVKILNGGFDAWTVQGFPVEQPMRAEGRIAAL